MCGIVGFVSRQSPYELPPVLSKMMSRVRHRGPDGSGQKYLSDGGWQVALGHQRLAIIDLDGGSQPMANASGADWIVFNGEIYNYREIRELLQAKGHVFINRSDTEVILNQYRDRGPEGLETLNGIFAFALWDSDRRELILARDRAGIKPLYYAKLSDGGLAFASELSPLLDHPRSPREISMEALVAYFFHDYVPAPRSMISGIAKLPPGHWLRWKDGKILECRAFWSLSRLDGSRQQDGAGKLSRMSLDIIEQSVKRSMVSDVPVAVFLSGGLDSSLVAALAQRQSGEALKTFSIGFEDATFDERGYAQQVASQLGTQHFEQVLSEKLLLETVEAAVGHLDEPLADPSLIPTYLLAQLAASHVKVALSGDGGDELWGGYVTYRAHQLAKLYAWIPASGKSVITRLVAKLPLSDRYQSVEWKLKRFTKRWDDDTLMRHLRWMSTIDISDLDILIPGTVSPLTDLPPLGEFTGINRVLALDFQTYLPGSVLTKVDRASMAHGLELRPPLLDSESINWAFSIHSRHKVSLLRSKTLLKETALEVLPRKIVNRKKKGFGIPLAAWLRGPLRSTVESVLNSSPVWDLALEGRACVSRNMFRKMHACHQNRREDWSKGLWGLVVLDRWVRRVGLSQVVRSESTEQRLAA